MLALAACTAASLPETALQPIASDSNACRCWVTRGEDTVVFYNRCASRASTPHHTARLRQTPPTDLPTTTFPPHRVPKCGSTTMLSYIDNASKRDGYPENSQGEERNAFNFYQANSPEDFDNTRWNPGPSRSYGLLSGMIRTAPAHRVMYERHVHFLDPNQVPHYGRPLYYINLLREPGLLRASSFYFARDCICNQRPAYNETSSGDTVHHNILHLEDEWCKSDWHRKSDALCSTDINSCWADMDACAQLFPVDAIGGTVGIDFLCGTSHECDQGQPIEQRLEKARANLRGEYLWVGVLERLTESLQLLQRLLPEYFGPMDASYWATQHVEPAGSSASGHAPPNPATLDRMRNESSLRAEFQLYDDANNLLDCKIHACMSDEQAASASHQSSQAS